MEEILASIRRIISEDDTDAPHPAAAAPPAPEPTPEPTPAPVRPAPKPAAAALPPAPAAKPEAEPDDVLELTDQVGEGGKVVPLAALDAAPAATEVELRDMADDPAPAVPEPEPKPEFEPAPVPAAAAPRTVAAEGDLVSQATAQAATASLAALAQAVDRQASGAPIGVGGRTLEDLVKEIMRPMIRDWLDAHLPGLVERLVRREIERIAHAAQD